MDTAGNKKLVLRQLADIFGGEVSREKILKVCEQNQWKVENCIESLMNTENSRNVTYKRVAVPVAQVFSEQQYTKDVVRVSGSAAAFQHKSKGNLHWRNNNNNSFLATLTRIRDNIRKGFRIMVIMRGPPGSGKSQLARYLIERFMPDTGNFMPNEFIFSTDDYFMDSDNCYKYVKEELEAAHNSNHTKVRESALMGLSPIVVDNTNIKFWEMLPYVQTALDFGYIVEILEPNTAWCYSPNECATKTKHKVPWFKIRKMMENYEEATVDALKKALKPQEYVMKTPQMRMHPPLKSENPPTNEKLDLRAFQRDLKAAACRQKEPETEEKFYFTTFPCNSAAASGPLNKESQENIPPKNGDLPLWELLNQANRYAVDQSKGRRNKNSSEHWAPKNNEAAVNCNDTNSVGGRNSKEKTVWKYMPLKNNVQTRNQANFLDLEPAEAEHPPLDTSASTIGLTDSFVNAVPKVEPAEIGALLRHSTSCPNENRNFTLLRNVYANKDVDELWDFFVKCRGDVKWAIDLLLHEDDLIADREDMSVSLAFNGKKDEYVCGCNGTDGYVEPLPTETASAGEPALGAIPKPQRIRARVARQKPNNLELKKSIESGFTFAEELYPKHAPRLRNRSHAMHGDSPTKTATATQATQTDADEETSSEEAELLQVTVDKSFIQALGTVFKSENALEDNLPPKETFQVFMPRSFAKELFMYCLEGVYNCAVEQRLETKREDEAFARLLKHPQYADLPQSPSNTQELLDMEMALDIYRKECEYEERDAIAPVDLATHLTQMKLCEMFPDIERELLIDLLVANGNRYGETVTMLNGTLEVPTLTQDQLVKALHDTEEAQKQQQRDQRRPDDIDLFKKNAKPDELKRRALCDFEAMRNMAQHHSQMKAECYSKAKEAIQQKNGSVAAYYSQVANLHKSRVDTFNQRAASCIMEVHKYSQDNPELLDLHYLHLAEALNSLDIFLDCHITELRTTMRWYKHIFVITGRGIHSVGGVSTIKSKVKIRLRERGLRWTEANPGLLKIKVFGSSRFTKNAKILE